MKTAIPVILILGAILTVGLAGDWIVDNVAIGNRLTQTAPSSTNSVMGALGVGTATPEAKLHVVGTALMEGTMDLSSNRIMRVAQPVEDEDAANKHYIDDLLQNIEPAGGISMGVYTNR